MHHKIYNHTNNLIQNFYIIGIEKKFGTLVSSVLSKYPNVDIPYLNVSDEVIINVSNNL